MSRVRPSSGPAVSLFPFLAVLLCTMGALLVLLVLFSQAARESESAGAAAARLAHHEELEHAREELAWRLEQVTAIRERTRAELARARMQLAGAEEDIRRFEDELAELERVAVALTTDGWPSDAEGGDLTALEARLAASRRAVEAADAERRRRPPAYAVLPYEGDNGTRRRPLYIECCIDGVFLQPEGVRLGPSDFEGPPGPGNPLASALRAAREYVARSDAADGDPDRQPYPLLLVRPSGVMAYYAAREAIQSWGSEFGYQFVDEDWELAYPPPDAGLAEVERRAVEESRQRLAWLAQVRPVRNARPTQQYRAATTRGGIVAEGGPSVLGDRSRFTWGGEADSQNAAGKAAGVGGDAGGAAGSDFVASDGSGDGDSAGSGSAGSGDGRYLGPSRFYAARGDAADGGNGAGGWGAGGADGHAAASAPDAAMVGQGPAGSGGVPGGVASTGAAVGSSIRNAADGGSAESRGADGGAGGAAASGSPGGQASAVAAGAGNAAGGGGSSQGQPGGGGGGPTLPGLAQQGPQQAGGSAAAISGSLAGSRGSNWASLATHDHPVPLTRPIRLECAADEFRMLDASGRVEARVPIGTRTADAVDPLVRSIHDRVAAWGLAGDRMYWRPELVLSATPDGSGRRADLERLLADSGLDTRRVDPLPVRSLPPVERTGGQPPTRSPR